MPDAVKEPKDELPSSQHPIVPDSSVENRVFHQSLLVQILFQESKDEDGGGGPGDVVEGQVYAVVQGHD